MTSHTDIAAIQVLWSSAAAVEILIIATVVKIKGSASGMISGGCLDGDVRERAMHVIASGRPLLVTYDSTSPDDIIFGLGLGCNGIVQVLIEPVMAGDPSGLLEFLSTCHGQRLTGRIATIFQNGPAVSGIVDGMRLMAWPDGRVTANFDHPVLRATLLAAMHDTEGRRHAIRNLQLPNGVKLSALIETIAPPTSLLLFGAGDDAIPVAQLAKMIGWHVTVIDARPEFAQSLRFPQADDVLCLRPEAVRSDPRLAITPETLVMIMTHSYMRDKELVKALLPQNPRFVGILGPKKRTTNLIDELARDGVRFTEEQLACLHGPAGLDIGAETPEEIAIS
ncbi:MAG: XdhC/CoxI family protein, partial [Verrucomicrobia bacterium]|nr:XdhC/CoxI family protein [Verrucomicrobiota bacterium]